MKKILTTIMAMVMMVTFGTVSAKAGGRVEHVDHVTKKIYNGDYGKYNQMYSLDGFELELSNGKTEIVDCRKVMLAYARINNLRDITKDNICKEMVLLYNTQTGEEILVFNYYSKPSVHEAVEIQYTDEVFKEIVRYL